MDKHIWILISIVTFGFVLGGGIWIGMEVAKRSLIDQNKKSISYENEKLDLNLHGKEYTLDNVCEAVGNTYGNTKGEEKTIINSWDIYEYSNNLFKEQKVQKFSSYNIGDYIKALNYFFNIVDEDEDNFCPYHDAIGRALIRYGYKKDTLLSDLDLNLTRDGLIDLYWHTFYIPTFDNGIFHIYDISIDRLNHETDQDDPPNNYSIYVNKIYDLNFVKSDEISQS
ncbi:hypothetical protein [Spiroplasma endosymbiont of Aspidapion aeneum]|uniref:hypothetical protein n=1 Tax=Spiroplasma endosymbiont of Aspidapion aeneum TaxID=3066276 RepID=UPI00313CD099